MSIMADDFDSGSGGGVGFKRRISDISDDSDTQQVQLPSFEETPLSPPHHQQQQSPPVIIGKEGTTGTVPLGSDYDLELFNCLLQKKAKCSSPHQHKNQEPIESEGVKENLGFEEADDRNKLDSGYDDVSMKPMNDDDKVVDVVVGFSSSVVQSSVVDGIEEESGEVSNKEVQMDSAVEDSNKGLADSCNSFGENVSENSFGNRKEQFLVGNGLEESISDSKSHTIEFTDENLGAVGGEHTDEKRNIREEVLKMGHNDNQRALGKDVRCALKIQVIDDTALIGSVSDSSVVNHMGRNSNKKNNKNQETVGYEKKFRRRAKGQKKCWQTNGNENVSTQMVEPQKGCEKIADVEEKGFFTQMVDPQKRCEKKVDVEEQNKKWAYSRKEMEDLRFVNEAQQKKKWIEIYCGFGPAVTKEYDGLVDSNHQKHIRVNFDPRPLLRKKDAHPPILSDEYCENMDNEIQNMDSVLDGDAVVQEELSEVDDDSDDEEYSSIQRPAFLVTGKPDFDSGPPEDGLEYLRRVRWEAEHIPKVKVAKVERSKLNKEQTIYMPNIPDIAKCPDHLLPLKQWEDAFLADFSELRLALSLHEDSSTKISTEPQSLPTVHELESPNTLLDTIVLEKLENLTTDDVDSSQSIDSSIQSSAANEMDDSLSLSSPKSLLGECGPTLSAIVRMDSVARVSMLRKRISSVETMSHLSRSDCVWLFALCAAVDTPLNADTCASLRCLLRKCASLRAQKAEMDDEVIMLNVLATISGKYFGQLES